MTPLSEILPEFYAARALVMDGGNLAGLLMRQVDRRAKREARG